MKPNKEGKYRINFYLNPQNFKDNVIIEYLKQRYSATDYIKETIYSMATNIQIPYTVSNKIKEEKITIKDEYEEIEQLNDIEL